MPRSERKGSSYIQLVKPTNKRKKRRSLALTNQTVPSEILDNFLYLGDEGSLEVNYLRQLGVRYIINTAKSVSSELAQVKDEEGNEAFVYLHLKMRDSPSENIFKFLQPGVAFIRK
jgi:hypothetical protein